MLRNLCFCGFILTLLPPLIAQTASPTGNPLRQTVAALDSRGLNLALQAYSDTLAGAPASPSAPHASAFQFFDLSADLDLGRLTPHLRRTRFYTSFHLNGRASGGFDGAYQSMIGITSPPGARLAELWLERRLGSLVRVRAGKIDANPDFALVNSAAGFLNSSFSYDPTFFTLPNYSNTAWGTELLLRGRHFHLNVAAFDPPQGTGALLIEEVGLDWDPVGWTGRVAAGTWQETGTIPSLSGFNEKGARGYYLVGEQKFWRHTRSGGQPEQSLSGFLQLGSASPRFSSINRHLGAGVVFTSPFAGRANDSVGISVTCGHLTPDPAMAFDYKRETILETYYSMRLNNYLSISPDVQYAIHPGGISTNHNAFAAGARIVLTLKAVSE